MKTYEIFGPSQSSNLNHAPAHTVQAASVEIVNGPTSAFYVFLDDSIGSSILHAIAVTPGLFVRTVDKK